MTISNKKLVSIIILNYNGQHLLEKNLPSVVNSVKHSKENHEIIVADNGSSDKSVEFIKNKFPHVRIICLECNHGFGRGYNIAIREPKNDIIVLLNNDVFVKEDFLAPLLSHFDNDCVFAVSAKSYLSDRTTIDSERTCGRFRLGRFQVGSVHSDTSVPELYLHGGVCAIDKNKFLELGGFDDIYQPAYYEDTDLGYRAWKRGWKIIYEPESIVYHTYMGTSKNLFTENEMETLMTRNNFLFTWKNITSKYLLLKHLFFLPIWISKNIVTGNFSFLKGLFHAMKKIKEVIRQREKNKKSQKLTDMEVFNITSR